MSIPSNIAEGQARNTTRDFLQFLAIAYGSLKELETQMLIAERLAYIDGCARFPYRIDDRGRSAH